MAARRGSLGKGVKGLGASTLSEEEETTAEELCNAAASVFQFYPLASLLGPELASLFEAAGAACGVHPGAVLPALLALIATFITPYASVRASPDSMYSTTAIQWLGLVMPSGGSKSSVYSLAVSTALLAEAMGGGVAEALGIICNQHTPEGTLNHLVKRPDHDGIILHEESSLMEQLHARGEAAPLNRSHICKLHDGSPQDVATKSDERAKLPHTHCSLFFCSQPGKYRSMVVQMGNYDGFLNRLATFFVPVDLSARANKDALALVQGLSKHIAAGQEGAIAAALEFVTTRADVSAPIARLTGGPEQAGKPARVFIRQAASAAAIAAGATPPTPSPALQAKSLLLAILANTAAIARAYAIPNSTAVLTQEYTLDSDARAVLGALEDTLKAVLGKAKEANKLHKQGFVLKSVCTILRSALVLHVAGFAFTHPAGRDVSDLDSVAPANSPPSEISAATIRCAIQLYELQLCQRAFYSPGLLATIQGVFPAAAARILPLMRNIGLLVARAAPAAQPAPLGGAAGGAAAGTIAVISAPVYSPEFTDLRGRCANLIKHLTTIAASSGTFVFYENNCFFLTIGSGKGNWAPLRPADKKKVVYDALTQGKPAAGIPQLFDAVPDPAKPTKSTKPAPPKYDKCIVTFAPPDTLADLEALNALLAGHQISWAMVFTEPYSSAVSNVEAGRPSCALKGVAAEAAAAAAEAEEQAEEAAEAAAVAQAEEAGAYSDEESEMEVDENGDPNGQPSRKRHHTGSAAR